MRLSREKGLRDIIIYSPPHWLSSFTAHASDLIMKTSQAPAALLASWPQPRLWHTAIQPQPERMETSRFLLSTNLLTALCCAGKSDSPSVVPPGWGTVPLQLQGHSCCLVTAPGPSVLQQSSPGSSEQRATGFCSPNR